MTETTPLTQLAPLPQAMPTKRGRPRKHFASDSCSAESARKAAYRARQRKKRLRREKQQQRRDLLRLLKAQGISKTHAYSDGFRSEFLRSTLIEQKLTNSILSTAGLGMTKGEFLTDAPAGAGLLISGGYDSDKVSFIWGKQERKDHQQGPHDVVELTDGRRAPLKSGHRVEPKGWSSHKDEQTGYIPSRFGKKARVPAGETDTTFIEKHAKDSSAFSCYQSECRRLVWGVRIVAGEEVYCCDLHKQAEGSGNA